MFFSGSVRKTLALVVLLSILPAMGIIAYYSINTRRLAMTNAIEDARDLVDALAAQNRHTINNTRNLLLSMAQLSGIREHDTHLVKELFWNILKKSPDYSNFILVTAQGDLVASVFPLEDFSFDLYPEFLTAGEKNSFAFGRTRMAPPNDEPIMYFTFPVPGKTGKVEGILGVSLKLRHYMETIMVDTFPSGQIRLHGPKGEVLFAQPSSGWGDLSIDSEWEAIAARPDPDGEFDLHTPTGGERFIAYQKIPFMDTEGPFLSIAFSLSRAAAYSLADYRFTRDLMFLALAILLALAMAGMVGQRAITRPIQALLHIARRLSLGDFSARPSAADIHGEMGRLAEAFTSMADSLEARDRELVQATRISNENRRAKNRFIANLSYEIRSPMHRVLGLSELIRQTPLPEKIAAYLDTIHAAAFSLQEVIKDILDYARIEAGILHMEKTLFRLEDVLESAVSDMRGKAGDKALDLRVQVAGDVPAVLKGDGFRLRQVLVNICSNAVKFSSSGTILISCALDEGETTLPSSLPGGPLEQSLTPEEDQIGLLFSVQDQGIGIAPDLQKKLFVPFSQADGSFTRKFGGVGLGLSISKGILKLMRGNIALQSSGEQGTLVTFSACFEPAQASPANGLLFPDRRAAARILVLDGNPVALKWLKDLLGKLFLKADGATSLEEGFSLLRSAEEQGNPYNLVILDYSLAEENSSMRGIAALFARPKLAAAPKIILLVNFRQDEIVTRAKEAGILDVLAKPVAPAGVRKVMDRFLGK